MRTTTETRTMPLAATFALFAALLLAVGCDGGIFGTGDGSPTELGPPVDATPSSVAGPGGGAPEPETAGPDAVDADSADASAADEVPQDIQIDEMPFGVQPLFNPRPVDPSASEPRIRVVNAGSRDVVITSVSDASGRPVVPLVAAGGVSDYVSIDPSMTALVLGHPSSSGADASLTEPQLLDSQYLDPASVTTLLVRDGPDGMATITVLANEIASGDPGVALVRLLPGSAPVPAEGTAAAASYTLVPAGADPGGVAVDLGSIALGGTALATYTMVPAGDYRLEGSDPGVPDRDLSFGGGTVRTLVLLASGALLVVADGG